MHPLHLIQQLRRADPEALQYVYNHSKAYCLGRLCRTMRCHPRDAEDIFMDAVLIFRENVVQGKVTEIAHLRAYLYRICLNRYHEQQQRKEKVRQTEGEVRFRLYEVCADSANELDDLLQKKALVMEAFRYLGENCRQLLHYYYFDHLSLAEIARKMNMANANVAKVTKARCYKKWVEAVAALKQKKDA